MHTIIVIAIGFGLLGLFAVAGRLLGGTGAAATAALAFLPLWLVVAAVNMYMGVTRAGYSVVDETPIFLVVLATPAVAAILFWRNVR